MRAAAVAAMAIVLALAACDQQKNEATRPVNTQAPPQASSPQGETAAPGAVDEAKDAAAQAELAAQEARAAAEEAKAAREETEKIYSRSLNK